MAVAIGGPAQLLRQIGQLAGRHDLRVVADDAFEQGRARARHADDEDRLRAVDRRSRGRLFSGLRKAFDQRIEHRLFGRRIVAQALVHDRVGALQGLPCLFVAVRCRRVPCAARIRALRDLREVILAAVRHHRQTPAQRIEVVAVRCLATDAGQVSEARPKLGPLARQDSSSPSASEMRPLNCSCSAWK